MLDEATGDGAQVDAAELALLQQMGLPTAFTSTKARAAKGLRLALQMHLASNSSQADLVSLVKMPV